MESLRIGEVATLAETGIETIRYYEREGLLPAPARRPSGYRLFDGNTVERLKYIRRAKDLGFTLAEIRDLLEVSFAPSPCQHIRQRAAAKIINIESKIRELKRMKRALGAIVERCQDPGAAGQCPLVHRTK